ncbi:YfcL family protein [Algicola sagamiensis]|uniref:YfcL family protein n=1 Tax=Algicola sagamiensis TaxID=163869 RepID=UPI000370EB10|nr:YfcL family protein [Algicola sagamiensis]
MLDTFIEKTNQVFDALVENGTDDELFAGGYLRGHFDLALGQLQITAEDFTIETLLSDVEQSLLKAIDQGELNAQDIVLVRSLMDKITALTPA